MSHSWNSPSNSSGFVYFSVNNSYQNNQSSTTDFLPFEDSPSYNSPQFNRFSPNNYSSPQKFNKSPRPYNNRNGFRYCGGQHNRSYNNSNNSFNSSYAEYSNSNNSYNSSYNNNTKRREHGPHNKKKNNGNGKTDMSMYFDHTSVRDPWAELEENLRKKREAETLETIDAIESKEETSVADHAETSSESDEEQETEEQESESKSNTSGNDEETT